MAPLTHPCLAVACVAVLVDEASMLDLQVAAALLRALPPGCQLVPLLY